MEEMMASNDYASYASEVKELETLLAMTPQKNILERRGLESRLKSVRAALEQCDRDVTPLRAKLTFRGTPVIKSHGIFADFALKATGMFSEAYAKIAASIIGRLGASGPIPDKGNNRLMIVGTAVGSFGFEFELPHSDAFPNMRLSEQAFASIIDLLRLSSRGSDDDLADVIEQLHPRAVSGLYDFLQYLIQEEAWCGIECGKQAFKYESREEQERATNRFKKENIKEADEVFTGEFQGVLPAGRTFEFKLHDQEGLIKGRIGAEVADPDILNRDWLHKKAKITLHGVRIGEGRPRYALTSMNSVCAPE